MLEFLMEEIFVYSFLEVTMGVALAVFIANAITIWLPNKSPYKPVQVVLDVLNKLSLNVLKNVNHPEDDKKDKRFERRFGGGEP